MPTRRELLQTLLAVTSARVLPSCKAGNPSGVGMQVVVVGAGAAGLCAAHVLRKAGASVRLLEASDRVCGRVKTLQDFADFPIELGAEEIHGENSEWYDLAMANGAQVAKADNTDHIFVDGKLTDDSILKTPDFQEAQDFVDRVGGWDGEEILVADLMVQEKVPSRTWPLLEAWIGNEYGSSNDRIGALAAALGDDAWSSGGTNIGLKNSYEDVLRRAFAAEVDMAETGVAVTAVQWNDEGVTVTTAKETIKAYAVILAVPLPVLRDGHIAIALPKSHTDALRTIGMGAGMKVILKFRSRFWPEDLGSLYGAPNVPEFWYTSLGRGTTPVLTAFVMGKAAENLEKTDDIVAAVIADLDTVFGEGVASGSLLDSAVANWGADPLTGGAYSSPTPGSFAARKALAQSIDDQIFFAGEAVHTGGMFATVHGAIETGRIAAEELLRVWDEDT